MPTTANNETLERIKNEVAEEQGYEKWDRVFLKDTSNRLWPIVCERFARAVALDALKEAAENARATEKHGLQGVWLEVDKSSITDEKNIKLL